MAPLTLGLGTAKGNTRRPDGFFKREFPEKKGKKIFALPRENVFPETTAFGTICSSIHKRPAEKRKRLRGDVPIFFLCSVFFLGVQQHLVLLQRNSWFYGSGFDKKTATAGRDTKGRGKRRLHHASPGRAAKTAKSNQHTTSQRPAIFCARAFK